MAASDVIAGRTVQEIQDKGVGPNGAFLRFRGEGGDVVSGVDNKGVYQALQGVAFSDGSIQTSAGLAPVGTFPRPGAAFWVSGFTTGIGNGTLTSPINGFATRSNLALSVSNTNTNRSATKHQFDLPANQFYANFSVNTLATSNAQSIINPGISFWSSALPFYYETKIAANVGVSGTNRIMLGLADSNCFSTAFPNAAAGIPNVAQNFCGFRMVTGGAGTKDTNWVAWLFNSSTHPGIQIDTGVAPDFANPHVFSIQFDLSNFIFKIDGITVATVAVGTSGVPFPTAGLGPGIYIDNNGTVNSDGLNTLTVKYWYCDSSCAPPGLFTTT